LLFWFLSVSLSPAQTNFQATPLNEYQPGQLYLGVYPGLLYDNSNRAPSDHDADGRLAAARVQPLDSTGSPSPQGKIVVIGIGMSNWNIELCAGGLNPSVCTPQSFISAANASSRVNKESLVVVDCAIPGQVANTWLDDSFLNYSACKKTLENIGLTEAQVQVVLYKDANPQPKRSLKPSTRCSKDFVTDACMYERFLGQTARFLKTRYANIQQMFLHSRIYAGYAVVPLNPG
jgi:hypothetical protein